MPKYVIKGSIKTVLCFATFMFFSYPFSAAANDAMLPTEALYLSLKSIAENPGLSRQEQVAKYYDRAKTDNLDDVQRFALAELHFINIKPKPALEGFEAFTGGDDLRSRIAAQRVMQVRFRAMGQFERVEKMVEDYRAKYKPIAGDVWHVDRQILNIGQMYQNAGEHQKVVDLVMREVSNLPRNAPYMSLRMPGQFLKSFEATGNLELAEKTIKAIQVDMKQAVANYVKAHPEGHLHNKFITYQPVTEYRMEEGLLGTAFADNYPSPELRLNQFNLIINELDGALWRIRIEKN